MRLTTIAIKNLQPKDKPYRRFDGGGLYIEVRPDGKKYWQMKYSYQGKERRTGFGAFPAISISRAREKRDELRAQMDRGVDPKIHSGRRTAEHAFRDYGAAWLKSRKPGWSERYYTSVSFRLKKYSYPLLGDKDVRTITAQDVLQVIRSLQHAPVLAKRVLENISAIFTLAIIEGVISVNPAYGLAVVIKSPPVQHHSYLRERDLPEFLRKMEEHKQVAHPITMAAMRFLMLTFVRTNEMRFASWPEFDLDRAEWRIPAERMKMKIEHIVPLSRQTLELLEEIRVLAAGSDWLFPSPAKPAQPISENAVLFAIYDMGYKERMTGHGFRSIASTILNENGWPGDVIERQLAHIEGNKVRKAYNHAEYLSERRKMMQWWADRLYPN